MSTQYARNDLNTGAGDLIGPASPVANPGVARQLYDDAGTLTLFSASVLPASGAWRRSEIINVQRAREGGLFLAYTAGASASGAYPRVIVLVSSSDLKPKVTVNGIPPLAGDDAWYALGQWDFSVTDAVLSGTLPTGSDFTATPAWRDLTIGPMVIRTKAAAAATSDAIRMMVNVKGLAPARWMQIIAAEAGDTAHPGTLDLRLSLTA